MKSSRMKVTAVLLTTAFTLSGCGEKLYVLTPEEEAAIVSYAAHTVAKYNNYQQDGEVFVLKEVLEGEMVASDTEMATESVDGMPDTEASTTETLSPDSNQGDTSSGRTESSSGTVTLTEALDLGSVKAEYMGYKLCTTYEKSDVYAVDAAAGKQLLVVNINLTNEATQDLHVDILASIPEIRAVINGEENVVAQTTILPDDLSTYQQDILAGETNSAVLLFEIPQEIQEVSDIQLSIRLNGNNYTVNL